MSIAQVAKLAGVSTATVSRVLNGRTVVNPETARQVRAAMRKLGYTPRADRRRVGAGAAATGAAGRVAVVTFGPPPEWDRNPVAAALLGGISRAARDEGLQVVLDEMANVEVVSPAIRAREVGGVIVLAADGATVPCRVGGLPTVWVATTDAAPPAADVDVVCADDVAAGHLAARHVVSGGHRLAATMNPVPGREAWEKRCKAFERSAARDEVRVHRCAGRGLGGGMYEVLEQMVREFVGVGPAATALFVPADSVAAAVYPLLRRAGREPGEGLEVVSCDNERVRLEALRPAPVTIDLGVDQIGRVAVRQLGVRMRDAVAEAPTRLQVAPRLVLPVTSPAGR